MKCVRAKLYQNNNLWGKEEVVNILFVDCRLKLNEKKSNHEIMVTLFSDTFYD